MNSSSLFRPIHMFLFVTNALVSVIAYYAGTSYLFVTYCALGLGVWLLVEPRLRAWTDKGDSE